MTAPNNDTIYSSAFLELSNGPVEIVLVGAAGEPVYEALRAEVARRFLPSRIVAHVDPRKGASSLPLPAGKTLVDGKAALYVCENFTCAAPVTDPAKVGETNSFEKPKSYATGVPYVIVNGVVVIDKGEHTGARPGRALRGPGFKRSVPTSQRQ